MPIQQQNDTYHSGSRSVAKHFNAISNRLDFKEIQQIKTEMVNVGKMNKIRAWARMHMRPANVGPTPPRATRRTRREIMWNVHMLHRNFFAMLNKIFIIENCCLIACVISFMDHKINETVRTASQSFEMKSNCGGTTHMRAFIAYWIFSVSEHQQRKKTHSSRFDVYYEYT